MTKLYNESFKQEHVVAGFRKCGIFPVSRSMIPVEKMLPAQVVADNPNTSLASVHVGESLGNEIEPDFNIELTPRNEVLTEESIIERIRVAEEEKIQKKKAAEQRKEAAAMKKLMGPKASTSKSKVLKSKLKKNKVKRSAKKIVKDLVNNKKTDEFSDLDEDNLNDSDFVVESGDRSGECSYSTKPRKLCRKSSAKSAVGKSPKRPISSVPGNLEELNINDCKLHMWVKVRYEEETYLGKIVEIENNETCVRCFKMPFGIAMDSFHEMEDEGSCCYFPTVYKSDVEPVMVKDDRVWKYKYIV